MGQVSTCMIGVGKSPVIDSPTKIRRSVNSGVGQFCKRKDAKQMKRKLQMSTSVSKYSGSEDEGVAS